MWLLGEALAAEAPANDSLIVVVGGIVVAAIGALGLVLVEVVKGRNSRTTASPVGPVDPRLPERVAVLEDWRKTTEKADDIHDRAVGRVLGDVEDIVHWMDREHPDWRP